VLKDNSANQRLSACTSARSALLGAMRRFPNRDVEDWIGLGFRLGGTAEMGIIRGFDSPQKANSPRLNLLGEPAPKSGIQQASDVDINKRRYQSTRLRRMPAIFSRIQKKSFSHSTTGNNNFAIAETIWKQISLLSKSHKTWSRSTGQHSVLQSHSIISKPL